MDGKDLVLAASRGRKKQSTMRPNSSLVLFLSLLTPSSAFVNVAWTRQTKRLLAVSTKIQGMRDDTSEDFDEDYEQVRRRLEAMMTSEEGSRDDVISPVLHRRRPQSSFLSGDKIPAPPPLTAISKERRMAEIQLLARLVDDDEGLDDLWSLWFSERGPHAARELRDIEELTAQGPRSWEEAEERLRDMIEEHGVYFVEPVNRLATLLFLQGRLEESRSLCETVLAVKPWHFGASSGIVMVCAGLGDPSAARQWAARRLPPIQPTGSNKRRHQWVERAVDDATKALFDAERRVKKAFGKPDERPKFDAFDEDAWQ